MTDTLSNIHADVSSKDIGIHFSLKFICLPLFIVIIFTQLQEVGRCSLMASLSYDPLNIEDDTYKHGNKQQ